MSEQKTTDMSQHFYRASAADFIKIPGSPVAYWATNKVIEMFENNPILSSVSNVAEGSTTGDVNRFLKMWFEVSSNKIGYEFSLPEEAKNSKLKWFPYNKGGEYRRWYGNNLYVVNWENNGFDIKNYSGSFVRGERFYFKPGITWSKVSSGSLSFRAFDQGYLFDTGGLCIFTDNRNYLCALLNSKAALGVMEILAPTLNFTVGTVSSIPVIENIGNINEIAKTLKAQAQLHWDYYETSWDFNSLPLLTQDIKQPTISFNYAKLREQWLADTQEMQRLEEENNRIFIEAYGLQDELTPEVPLKEITLTCNPHYRYGGDLTEQEREDRLQSDTIAELLSYAIGCMMGRYSLDREGLVYAHAGNEGFADLVAEDAYKTFAADDDGILPLTEQEWFSDDVTNRISEFVHTVWGEQHLEENLQFIADSLCLYALKAKKGERALDTIRRYLSNQFYKDHLKTYKRRPIYWLFSSGKHKAFECLVYLHRYHEGTLARMRTEYVIPLSSRINARINRLQEEAEAASSTSERKQLMTELKTLQNQQAELATFDEQLRHHADQRISLDLDDGVKENYGKFGNLLSAVKDVTGK